MHSSISSLFALPSDRRGIPLKQIRDAKEKLNLLRIPVGTLNLLLLTKNLLRSVPQLRTATREQSFHIL